ATHKRSRRQVTNTAETYRPDTFSCTRAYGDSSNERACRMRSLLVCLALLWLAASARILGQLVDKNKAPNTPGEGISRPPMNGAYPTQIGDGRWGTDPNASLNVIAFDPFRAIRRGRQLFQRKFTRLEGQGPGLGDGFGDVDVDLAIGAGLADSCAACHGRPR